MGTSLPYVYRSGTVTQPHDAPTHKLQHDTERLKKGASLVDVGTFIGQDLRRLIVDGAPSTNLYAVDIVNHWDIVLRYVPRPRQVSRNGSGQGHSTVKFPVRKGDGRSARLLIYTDTPIQINS